LLFYYIEVAASNDCATAWLEGSFSQILFPRANLHSQRIRDLLAKLGNDSVASNFFEQYLDTLSPQTKEAAIVFESPGLPYSTHLSINDIGNNDEYIKDGYRLIYAIDRNSGLPLYYRYFMDDFLNIKALDLAVQDLKEYGISLSKIILCSDYCSAKHIHNLFELNINFLMNVTMTNKFYADTLNNCGDDILSDSCRYFYGDYIIGIKRSCATLFGHRGYMYICADCTDCIQQIKLFTEKAKADKNPRDGLRIFADKLNVFAFASSAEIEPAELLPLYYAREAVDQEFGLRKFHWETLPFSGPDGDTLRGHILLSFMALILTCQLNQRFKQHKSLTARNALGAMYNLKCKVFDGYLLVPEPTKKMREICRLAGVKLPKSLKLPFRRPSPE
jgi:hypothetical protein